MGNKLIMPKKVYYGEGALNDAASSIAQFGKKALIVTDEMMLRLGNVNLVTGMLESQKVAYEIFSGVTGEPTDKMVECGVQKYCEEHCDFLIAVGGGSPIDTMKAIAVSAVSHKSIDDYYGKNIDVQTPPMAAIPTTSGTGSEATQFTIITNTRNNVKMLLKGETLMPDLAVDDPAFTITAPPSVTAATGLDALCHASEAYTSRKAHALTDDLALSAIKKIFTYLPRAFENGKDVEARAQMSLAALEAGIAFNNASVTIIHGMSRPIGALFHVPHGVSNAMLLVACFREVYRGDVHKFADMARVIGKAGTEDCDEIAAGKFIEACGEICRFCRIPTLAEYGVDKKNFFAAIEKMAEDAMASGSPANTIKEVTKEDIIKIYKVLWNE